MPPRIQVFWAAESGPSGLHRPLLLSYASHTWLGGAEAQEKQKGHLQTPPETLWQSTPRPTREGDHAPNTLPATPRPRLGSHAPKPLPGPAPQRARSFADAPSTPGKPRP